MSMGPAYPSPCHESLFYYVALMRCGSALTSIAAEEDWGQLSLVLQLGRGRSSEIAMALDNKKIKDMCMAFDGHMGHGYQCRLLML